MPAHESPEKALRRADEDTAAGAAENRIRRSALQHFIANQNITRSPGILRSRNIRIHGKRTSVRLEQEMWDALKAIAAKENVLVSDLCSAVYESKDSAASFSAALRVFLVEYYRYNAHRTPKAETEVALRQES